MLCTIPVLLHIAIVTTAHFRTGPAPDLGTLFKFCFVTASAITHWGIYTSLLITFALTLRPGHEALITAMARKMHGNIHGGIEEELAQYTRRVTIAWCGFFALQLATSITLFWVAPLVIWSFFVNILDIPLVATMFLAEYCVRLRVLRNPPRHSFSVILKMIGDSAGKNAVHANPARPD